MKQNTQIPKFSFIIPVLNGEKTIASTLQSLTKQTYPHFEIIVVDNGSFDKTREIVKSFSKVRYFYLAKRSRSRARNRGAREAQGNFFAFVDADVILAPDWLEQIHKYLLIFPLDAVTGSIQPSAQGRGPLDGYRKALAKWKTSRTYLSVLCKGRPIPLINTASCVVSKESFDKVGGFDNELNRHEDLELSLRLFLNGYLLGATQKAKAHVQFTTPANWPVAREVAYLQRSFEIQYTYFFGNPAITQINWELLNFIWRDTRQPSLVAYGAAVELVRAVARGARRPTAANYFPKLKNRFGKSTLAFSYQQNKKVYLPRPSVKFLFINGRVYALFGRRKFKFLNQKAAGAIKKLSRGETVGAAETSALTKSGLFRALESTHAERAFV